MKKIFAIFIFSAVVMMPFAVGAQQNKQGIHEPGTGLEDPELKQENQGTGQALEDGEVLQYQNQAGNNTNSGSQYQNQGENTGPGNNAMQNPELYNGQGKAMQNQGASRQSRVANSVQAMEQIAANNPGIGEQVRTIAQNQVRLQDEAEQALANAKSRSGFMKFLVGPDYGQLKRVQTKLDNHLQNMAELSQLREQVRLEEDRVLLDDQIATMQQIKSEMEDEVKNTRSGFSLFGWLSNIFN